jgi:transposase-like protein
MILEPLPCPTCNGTDVIKHGTTAAGKQRYRCQNPECQKKTFIRDYSYEAYLPQVKQKISDMAMNESGIRDTARMLGISPNTVIDTLKKSLRSSSSQ